MFAAIFFSPFKQISQPAPHEWFRFVADKLDERRLHTLGASLRDKRARVCVVTDKALPVQHDPLADVLMPMLLQPSLFFRLVKAANRRFANFR